MSVETIPQRADAITSDDLFWNGAAGVAGNGGVRPKLFAPDPFRPGSSVAHLDERRPRVRFLGRTT
jgi:hypothetical protein